MIFFNKYKFEKVKRDFDPPFLLNPAYQSHFNEFGYVIIKNIITEENINWAKDAFEMIKKKDGFLASEIFESTGNFKNKVLQQYIFKFIEAYMSANFSNLINLNNCEIGRGGAFFIKPNTIKSKLEPHQDSPVIDERETYAMFAWIPLQDINAQNGALYVLPKSHLWGNYYRSQHIPWALGNICNALWKYMIPLYINKGDVVLFDPSLIHASEINESASHRIVVCGAILPKQHTKVEFKRAKNSIKKYLVDDDYWLDGGTEDRLTKYPHVTLTSNFPNQLNMKSLKALLKNN
jgi:ectoine hydroxylase-related dioxygenase (phytanoyl-CoA dioxygenase family)